MTKDKKELKKWEERYLYIRANTNTDIAVKNTSPLSIIDKLHVPPSIEELGMGGLTII